MFPYNGGGLCAQLRLVCEHETDGVVLTNGQWGYAITSRSRTDGDVNPERLLFGCFMVGLVRLLVLSWSFHILRVKNMFHVRF